MKEEGQIDPPRKNTFKKPNLIKVKEYLKLFN